MKLADIWYLTRGTLTGSQYRMLCLYLGSIVSRKVINHKGSLTLLSFGLIIKLSVIRVIVLVSLRYM